LNTNAIYIIPQSSVFSQQISNTFPEIKSEDLSFLKSSLYLNMLENILAIKDKVDIFCLFDEKDKEIFPIEFQSDTYKVFFENLSDKKNVFEKLSSKEFADYKNNILIFADVIDIRSSTLDQYFNLLNIDDESIVLAKNKEGIIGVLGFNNLSADVFHELENSSFILDKLLSINNCCKQFIHVVKDVLIVRNISNFIQLYSELSQKKSIEYCSQEMHERFTHLFIEYKDLLK
jgi:hypothetical protein